MRIGIHTGSVVVGTLGNDLWVDYAAIGDTTNLAARMESLARPGAILVSRDIHRFAKVFFEFKPLEKVEVKGKEEPQEAFELMVGEVETRIEAAAAKDLTRFVGRKNSIAAFIEAYEEAKSGSGLKNLSQMSLLDRAPHYGRDKLPLNGALDERN